MWANAQRDGCLPNMGGALCSGSLPNIGGALCSMLQSLADTQY